MGVQIFIATHDYAILKELDLRKKKQDKIAFHSLYREPESGEIACHTGDLDRAYRPALRGPTDRDRKRLLTNLQKTIDGKVTVKKEEFFLPNKQGNLEFTLLAEGMRKLGLLWLLIQNGTLLNGSVLFWDEPETNLNPKLFGPLIEILLELQRMGVQIFIATHDYAILKEHVLGAAGTELPALRWDR